MIRDLTQVVLRKGLDAAALRHRAIADNIANVETPGYTRQKVSFEDQLRTALNTPDSNPLLWERRIEPVQAAMSSDPASPMRENGNNVDVDREMADLAENTLNYQSLLQSMSIKGAMLRTAIYEGKR